MLGVGLDAATITRQFEGARGRTRSRALPRGGRALIRALCGTRSGVTFHGKDSTISRMRVMSPRPVQNPMPLWMGVGHPTARSSAHRRAGGWLDGVPGGSSIAEFGRSVPLLEGSALAARGRDPENFPISKRIFMMVDDNAATALRRLLDRWFTEVYHNPPGTDFLGHPRYPRAGARAAGRKWSRWARTTSCSTRCRTMSSRSTRWRRLSG